MAHDEGGSLNEAAYAYSPDGLGVMDSAGTLRYATLVCEKFFGLPLHEQIGKNIREFVSEGILYPSVADKVLDTGMPITVTQRTRTGRTLIVTGTPILDSAGSLTGVILNHRDTSILMETHLVPRPALHALRPFASRSESMRRVLEVASRLALTDAPILIAGETGTGKTVLCKFIHTLSRRSDVPIEFLNCAANPMLLEAQISLCGKGFLGRSGGVTLVLEDVADLPLKSQAKLLNLFNDEMPTMDLERVSEHSLRILATTNKDLEVLVTSGLFRRDLFYRLNTFHIRIPALRERIVDIPEIAREYLNRLNAKYGSAKFLTRDALSRLLGYDWPGNVRELQQVLFRAALLSDRQAIDSNDLVLGPIAEERRSSGPVPWNQGLAAAERRMILAAAITHTTVKALANALGLSEPTLRRRVKVLFGSWDALRQVSGLPRHKDDVGPPSDSG